MYSFVSIPKLVDVRGFCTAFEDHPEPNFIFRGETHEMYELVIVLGGSMGITAGSNSFILNEGAAVLHPPMEFHSLRSAKGTLPHFVVFSFLADTVPSYRKRVFVLSEEERLRVCRILDLLVTSTDRKDFHLLNVIKGGEKKYERAIREFEILLLNLNEVENPDVLTVGTTGSRNYQQAQAVLKANLHRSLNTEELAALCHMSPSLLKKTFSRYAGVGVMEYFRTQKILAAIPYLRNGQSVSETALRFGFSDARYFSTVFHKITGHTPSYYREH